MTNALRAEAVQQKLSYHLLTLYDKDLLPGSRTTSSCIAPLKHHSNLQGPGPHALVRKLTIYRLFLCRVCNAHP